MVHETSRGTESRDESALRQRLFLALSLLVASAIHLWASRGASGPVWMDDEVGYLGNAAFLAGKDLPPLASLGYWGGWSLSLVPLYAAGLSPSTIYTGAVTISALFGAAVLLPLRALARDLGATRTVATATALIVVVAPERTVLSNYALAENALVLACAVAAACFARAVNRHGGAVGAWFIAGGVASLMAFLVHARGAGLVAAAVMVGATLALRAGTRLLGASLIVVCAAGAGLVYRFNDWLVAGVYADASGARESDLVSQLQVLDASLFLLPASGQAWYQFVAWGGLSLAGAAVAVFGLVQGVRKAHAAALRDLYFVVMGTSTALLSILTVSGPISRGTTRIDFFFYGRYLTQVATIFAVVGLVWLFRRAYWRHVVALLALGTILSVSFAARGANYGDQQRVFAPINVPAVAPFPWPSLTDVSEPPILWLSLVALAVPVIIVALRRRPLLVTILFVITSVAALSMAQRLTIDRFNQPVRDALTLRHELEVLDEQRLVIMSEVGPFHVNGYTFWATTPVEVLPHGAVPDVDLSTALIATPEVVPEEMPLACEFDGRVCLYFGVSR